MAIRETLPRNRPGVFLAGVVGVLGAIGLLAVGNDLDGIRGLVGWTPAGDGGFLGGVNQADCLLNQDSATTWGQPQPGSA